MRLVLVQSRSSLWNVGVTEVFESQSGTRPENQTRHQARGIRLGFWQLCPSAVRPPTIFCCVEPVLRDQSPQKKTHHNGTFTTSKHPNHHNKRSSVGGGLLSSIDSSPSLPSVQRSNLHYLHHDSTVVAFL
jgi:hypothetical protein